MPPCGAQAIFTPDELVDLGLPASTAHATPGALNAFAATGENPINYIIRHMNLDPGSLGAEDQLQNATSFKFTAKTPPLRISDEPLYAVLERLRPQRSEGVTPT